MYNDVEKNKNPQFKIYYLDYTISGTIRAILVDDPFLALGMTVNFPPWERFFDFPFRSYSSFRKKFS